MANNKNQGRRKGTFLKLADTRRERETPKVEVISRKWLNEKRCIMTDNNANIEDGKVRVRVVFSKRVIREGFSKAIRRANVGELFA